MSLSPLDLCAQLLSDRLTGPNSRWQIIGGSSTRQQALREADAAGVWGLAYVSWLLALRQEREAERSRKRRQREARWAAIAAGERAPLDSSTVDALWSDFSEAEVGMGIRVRRRRERVEAVLT